MSNPGISSMASKAVMGLILDHLQEINRLFGNHCNVTLVLCPDGHPESDMAMMTPETDADRVIAAIKKTRTLIDTNDPRIKRAYGLEDLL